MEQITALVEEGLSQRQIAARLMCSQTNVRYHLKKLGLRTRKREKIQHLGSCALCSRSSANGDRLCNSCRTRIRRIRVKLAAIKFLGGKCNKCGWAGHISGFEFNHLNPSEKSYNIGDHTNKSWDGIEQELRKCELLCSICHRIHHSNRDEDVIRYAKEEYKGRLLDF